MDNSYSYRVSKQTLLARTSRLQFKFWSVQQLSPRLSDPAHLHYFSPGTREIIIKSSAPSICRVPLPEGQATRTVLYTSWLKVRGLTFMLWILGLETEAGIGSNHKWGHGWESSLLYPNISIISMKVQANSALVVLISCWASVQMSNGFIYFSFW